MVHLFSLPIQFETFLASLVASCVFPDQNIFFLLFPGDKEGKTTTYKLYFQNRILPSSPKVQQQVKWYNNTEPNFKNL